MSPQNTIKVANDEKSRKRRETFFQKLTEKHHPANTEMSSKNGKLSFAQRAFALFCLIAIPVLAFAMLDYIGRAQRALEQVNKYKGLVHNYEQLGGTDTDLLYNCVESELMEPSDENMSQNSQESKELLDAKESMIKTINRVREELGLKKSELNIYPRKESKLLPEAL